MNLTGVPDMVTTFSRAMAMQQEAKAYRRCAEWMKTLEAEQCWDFESPFEAWAVEAERRATRHEGKARRGERLLGGE